MSKKNTKIQKITSRSHKATAHKNGHTTSAATEAKNTSVVARGVGAADGTVKGSETLLTPHEAAALIRHNSSSIVRWINDGKLPAFKSPGGHRRILARDLKAFAEANSMFVPEALVAAALAPPQIGPEDVR